MLQSAAARAGPPEGSPLTAEGCDSYATAMLPQCEVLSRRRRPLRVTADGQVSWHRGSAPRLSRRPSSLPTLVLSQSFISYFSRRDLTSLLVFTRSCRMYLTLSLISTKPAWAFLLRLLLFFTLASHGNCNHRMLFS